MSQGLNFKKNKKRSGSIMLYTLTFLVCILFLGTFLIKMELNSLKYINEDFERFNREASISNGKNKLLTDFYNYIESENINCVNFQQLLEKKLEFKKSLKIKESYKDKNINEEKTIMLYYRDNILNIDYEYKYNLYIHETYELIWQDNKFFLKNMNNNISNEENNY